MNTIENEGKVSSGEKSDLSEDKTNVETQPLPFHNPLKPDDDKQITQEDLENEQKYKEAFSERD